VDTERWGGLPLTLILSICGMAFAFPLAILLALGRRSKLPAIRVLCVSYIELIRGVPLISLLFMASVMFPLFLPEGMNINKLLRAQIAIIMFAAAYLAEVVRGGLQSLPKGQYEAADALGLSYWQAQRLIILPQALRITIPPLVNTLIGMFKDTSLVVIIGLYDLMNSAKLAITDAAWRGSSIEAYVFVSVIYFCFCYFMSKYSQNLELRLGKAHHR
jgi:general L-amino acid transport system permease protein